MALRIVSLTVAGCGSGGDGGPSAPVASVATGGSLGSGAPTGTDAPRFTYVTNTDENTISMYAVNAVSGQLRSFGYVLSGLYPFSIAVDPSGHRAYVANQGSNNVSVFTIDGATGALTAVGTFAGAAPADGPVSIITTGTVQ